MTCYEYIRIGRLLEAIAISEDEVKEYHKSRGRE